MNSPEYIKCQKPIHELHELAKILVGFSRDLIVFKNLKLTYDNLDVLLISYTFHGTQTLIRNLLMNLKLCEEYFDEYKKLKEKNEFDRLRYTFRCKFYYLLEDLIFELLRRQVLLHEKTVRKVLNQL